MSSGLLEPTHFADLISEPDTARLQLGRPTILTSESVEAIATQTTPEVAFSAAARIAMAQSAECLQIAHLRGDPIYGLTTGFGPSSSSTPINPPSPRARASSPISPPATASPPRPTSSGPP
jgi:hypothetical protein